MKKIIRIAKYDIKLRPEYYHDNISRIAGDYFDMLGYHVGVYSSHGQVLLVFPLSKYPEREKLDFLQPFGKIDGPSFKTIERESNQPAP